MALVARGEGERLKKNGRREVKGIIPESQPKNVEKTIIWTCTDRWHLGGNCNRIKQKA